MDSARTSNDYYDRIGMEGLSGHRDPEETDMEVSYILERLREDDQILDAACGYGRIAIPLVDRGFSVKALDLSRRMVGEARSLASQEGIDLRVEQGDVRRLPFSDGEFSVVLCLWSAFNSLLSRDDQQAAVQEFHRVLAPGGWALVDLADGDKDSWMLLAKGSGPDGHVIPDYFMGGGNAIYLHTRSTVERLLEMGPFEDYEVSRGLFGGRRRLLVTLRK